MNRYILPLADTQVTLETVGGKGASLARLLAAGLPVPGGFHITTEAYRQFVVENGLQPVILAALKDADPAQPDTLEAASRSIREAFGRAPIPVDIAEAVASAYRGLRDTPPAVAIRSSATAEDLPEASFAGQQETYLNVTGTEAVLEAVRRCWASLWTARAIAYRVRQGIDPNVVSLAVVVQIMIPADAAGILFTANPMTGQRNQAVINAAWGLGEAIVGGLVTPDMLTVDKATGEIVERQTAHKEMMTVRVDGTTTEQPVPEDLRDVPVLDEARAAELVQLGARIEELYGQPTDIEWTLEDGQFAIVQARPITALPEATAAPPTEWPLPDPKGHYMRASIIDLMPDPLSPLFETLGMRIFFDKMQKLVSMLSNSDYVLKGYSVTTINGYAYFAMNLSVGELLFLMIRVFPSVLINMGGLTKYWRETACPKYAETTARWEQKAHDEMTAVELLNGVRDVFDAAMEHLTSSMTFLGACAGSEGLTTNLYNRMVKREGDPLAPALLMGFDSAPVRSEKALYDLALWCRAQPGLAEYMLTADGQQIADHTKGNIIPGGVSEAVWQEWKARFGAYLKEFGRAIYDLDFAKPLPSDEPAPILEACKLFIRGEGKNPYERQQVSAERREATVEMAMSRLRGLRRWLFSKALGWAQGLGPLREDSVANMGYGYPVLRSMLFEIGRRLVNRGVIVACDDALWLHEDELEQLVIALDQNVPIDSLVAVVEEHKALWRARKSVTPPPQVPVKERYMGFKTDVFLAHGEQEGNMIKGVAASPGRVKATARVLHGPEDFGQMQLGDVLVASITTPAWTPLFAMASAVVTDVGGPLSHGSIVAREYGIPAVLGTGVATKCIHSGQVITVDGDAGIVTLSGNGEKA